MTVELKSTRYDTREKLLRLARGAESGNPISLGVMASPPTKSDAGTTTSISSPQVVLCDDARVLTSGVLGVHPAFGSYGYKYGVNVTDGAGTVAGYALRHEIYTDAAVVEFDFAGTNSVPSGGASLRFLVDGQYVSLTPDVLTPDSAPHHMKLDFSALAAPNKMKRIEVETSNVPLKRVVIGPLDRLYAPPTQDGVRLGLLGDSYTSRQASQGAVHAFSGPACQAAKLLGIRDVWNLGVPGSGYLEAPTPRTRIPTDVAPYTFDMLWVLYGINSYNKTASNVQAEVNLTLDALRAAQPNIPIFVFGAFTAPGQKPPSAVMNAISAAAGGRDNLFFVDLNGASNPVQFGTGRVGATTGTGNSDRYIHTDNVHPSAAGDTYLGAEIDRRIRTAYATMLA